MNNAIDYLGTFRGSYGNISHKCCIIFFFVYFSQDRDRLLCVDNVVNIYKKLLEFVWDIPADIELGDLQSVSAASTERKFMAICQQSLEFTSGDTFCSSI